MLTRKYIAAVQRLMDQTDRYACAEARFRLMDSMRARVESSEKQGQEGQAPKESSHV